MVVGPFHPILFQVKVQLNSKKQEKVDENSVGDQMAKENVESWIALQIIVFCPVSILGSNVSSIIRTIPLWSFIACPSVVICVLTLFRSEMALAHKSISVEGFS